MELEQVREYINNLNWSEEATEREKRMVKVNIFEFWKWLQDDKPDKTVEAPDYDMVLGG